MRLDWDGREGGGGGGDIKPKMDGRREGQTIVCRFQGIVYGMTNNEGSYLIDRTGQRLYGSG